jgi:cation diffusion facilitator CzcD-associated flavoprotein CzcO
MRNIKFGYVVKRAFYSSTSSTWVLETNKTDTNEVVQFTCRFLFTCCGYYDYDAGFTPNFNGSKRFRGTIIHPQHWPKQLDYTNKNIVVIGSGATAVTLVPELAKHAQHVSMIQRSPTYIVSLPAVDPIAKLLHRLFPSRLSHFLIRWKNILTAILLFWQAKATPNIAKLFIKLGVKDYLGSDFDIDKHFSPKYNPWDQRVCVVPDGDFFLALKTKKASIITDTIETFTESGVQLTSGPNVTADIIVTATGLNLKLCGGIQIYVDGKKVDASSLVVYKGVMLSNIPNMVISVGYTNNTWTLKCDLTCEYFCNLLQYMDKNCYKSCVPVLSDCSAVKYEPLLNLSSGYIQRDVDKFPKQGSKYPWKYYQNFLLDIVSLRLRPIVDGVLKFS